MKRFSWPKSTDEAVVLLPRDHPNVARVTAQILDHARAGQLAFRKGYFTESKYHRDCCSLLIWRLGVDGLTANGQLRLDGAKYETRLSGRLSSDAARKVRESLQFTKRAQSALKNHVACDHIVPRNCVSETLVRPGWWEPDDLEGGRDFLLAHGDVAIISLGEDGRLDDAKLKSRMPAEWWDAPLREKATLRFSRYEWETVDIVVTAIDSHG